MTKLIVAAGVLLVLVSGCMTISDQDFAVIQTASDRFLLRVPDDGFMISADQLLKKIQSGSQDFVIVDVRETRRRGDGERRRETTEKRRRDAATILTFL